MNFIDENYENERIDLHGKAFRSSRSIVSCTLHDVQLPQSARASITASHCDAISPRRSAGAGFVNVGFE